MVQHPSVNGHISQAVKQHFIRKIIYATDPQVFFKYRGACLTLILETRQDGIT